MVAQNLMNRGRREDGGPQHGHRRLICVGNSQGMGCAVAGSCSVVPIEHAIMSYCADQMNLARLFEGGDRSEALAGKLAIARARVADTTAKVGCSFRIRTAAAPRPRSEQRYVDA